MHTNLCFATPIYKTKLVDSELELVQSELTPIYQSHLDSGIFSDPWNNGRLQTTNGTLAINIAEEYSTPVFLSVIEKNIRCFLQSVGQEYKGHKIASMWMTRMVKHCYSQVHSHTGVNITGVYYFKTNGKDGNFLIENPMIDYAWTGKVGLQTLLPDVIPETPEIGKLILFPSWVRHSVETNLTENDRISISFNVNIE